MNHSSSILGAHRAGGLINSPVSNTKAKRVLARGAALVLKEGCEMKGGRQDFASPVGSGTNGKRKVRLQGDRSKRCHPKERKRGSSRAMNPKTTDSQGQAVLLRAGAGSLRALQALLHLSLPDSYPTVRAGNTSCRSVNIGQLGFSPHLFLLLPDPTHQNSALLPRCWFPCPGSLPARSAFLVRSEFISTALINHS